MNLKKLTSVLSFFLLIIRLSPGQTNESNLSQPAQLGFSGLIYTPSAYVNPWKTIDVGFTHFSTNTSFTYQAGLKPERAFITNLVFLPRVAFSLKLTRPYSNLRPGAIPGSGQLQSWGIGDRSIGIKIQVLKEKKYQPALVLGIQDPATSLAFFNTNYLVLSKTILWKDFQFSPSMGYGFEVEKTIGNYLKGIFGGILATWKRTISGMLEYDAKKFNVGIGYQLKNRLFLNVSLTNAQYFSGNISYRFSLN